MNTADLQRMIDAGATPPPGTYLIVASLKLRSWTSMHWPNVTLIPVDDPAILIVGGYDGICYNPRLSGVKFLTGNGPGIALEKRADGKPTQVPNGIIRDIFGSSTGTKAAPFIDATFPNYLQACKIENVTTRGLTGPLITMHGNRNTLENLDAESGSVQFLAGEGVIVVRGESNVLVDCLVEIDKSKCPGVPDYAILKSLSEFSQTSVIMRGRQWSESNGKSAAILIDGATVDCDRLSAYADDKTSNRIIIRNGSKVTTRILDCAANSVADVVQVDATSSIKADRCYARWQAPWNDQYQLDQQTMPEGEIVRQDRPYNARPTGATRVVNTNGALVVYRLCGEFTITSNVHDGCFIALGKIPGTIACTVGVQIDFDPTITEVRLSGPMANKQIIATVPGRYQVIVPAGADRQPVFSVKGTGNVAFRSVGEWEGA